MSEKRERYLCAMLTPQTLILYIKCCYEQKKFKNYPSINPKAKKQLILVFLRQNHKHAVDEDHFKNMQPDVNDKKTNGSAGFSWSSQQEALRFYCQVPG